jgi:hypothetical protein
MAASRFFYAFPDLHLEFFLKSKEKAEMPAFSLRKHLQLKY